jgi:hypothetical protein
MIYNIFIPKIEPCSFEQFLKPRRDAYRKQIRINKIQTILILVKCNENNKEI